MKTISVNCPPTTMKALKPNFRVSASIADATEKRAEYIHKRGLDQDYYEKLIVTYLKKFKQASKQDINGILLDKLGNALDEKQKIKKISNTLSKLRMKGVIKNYGSDRAPVWKLLGEQE